MCLPPHPQPFSHEGRRGPDLADLVWLKHLMKELVKPE